MAPPVRGTSWGETMGAGQILKALSRVAAFCALVAAGQAMSETAVGSNVDSRVVLALEVNADAAQSRLPEGWRLLSLPKGPLAGANLLMVFIDRRLLLDPEGAPRDPHQGYGLALVSYATHPDHPGARLFVTRVFETPPVADSYGNGTEARFGHELTRGADPEGGRYHRESWTVAPGSGGEIALSLDYRPGRPVRARTEAEPYSAARPDFHRIYRYEQLADLAQSTAMGKALDGTLSLRSTVPELADLLDGQEKIVALMVVPVYLREVFLP